MIIPLPQHEYFMILEREKQLRDRLPEHTLDWYTYTNRVNLLQELVEKHIVRIPVDVPFKEAQKPEPPAIQMIKEGVAKKPAKVVKAPVDTDW